MQEYQIFLAIGGALLCGLVADEFGRRTPLPRVTVLILLGVFAGDAFLGIIPSELNEWYGFLATVALTMVAFLLGGRLSLSTLKEHGKEILLVSLSVVSITVFFVGAGLILLGVPFEMAIVLAGIATATAPAATQDVVKQTGAKGPFTDTLLGVVAIDDAWGLMLFSFLLIAAATTSGNASPEGLYSGVRDIGIAVAIGVIIGLPAAYLTGRLKKGEPIQSEALGVVFLCAGTALWLDVSFLLAGIAAGATVVNFARHHARPVFRSRRGHAGFRKHADNRVGGHLVYCVAANRQVRRWMAGVDPCRLTTNQAPLDRAGPGATGRRGIGHGAGSW